MIHAHSFAENFMTTPSMAEATLPHPSLHGAAGLTLRDLVETTPEAVTDSWCRQVAGHLLRTVEQQQAQQRSHRIIMPDTVVVHADGAADVLASNDDDEQFQPPVAMDLKAIAAVLHFAITGESPPGAALLPRGLRQFGDDLLGAIDACLHGDRSHRPQSIDAMRGLLGLAPSPDIVAAPVIEPVPAAVMEVPPAPQSVADELDEAIAGLAAAVGVPVVDEPVVAEPGIAEPAVVEQVVAKPATEPLESVPAVPPPPPVALAKPAPAAAPVQAAVHPVPPSRMSRPLLACLAIGLLGAAGFVIYDKGRQAGAEDAIAAAPPVARQAEVPAVAPAPPPEPAAPAEAAAPTSLPTEAPAVAEAPVQARAAPVSTTYKLMIKPWGEVYVDGVKRGISPPLKTLTLSGAHTVRIDNPDFPSQTFNVEAGADTSTRIEHAFQ